ncbi:endoglucanase IV [Phaeosphaeria sp. MPI-PUGE-AT-0046c]|nr:endoglucanase IV [Phaeosphaeria sp. MPI-PUGE-AT-0046c]
MWCLLATSFVAALPFASAHGRITEVTTSTGMIYKGWDPEHAQPSTPIPQLAAWSASNLGNIYVPPSKFNTTDITCHFNATPGALHIDVMAGDTLTLQWNEWPTSHVGPIMTYLAACNRSCTTTQKNTLEWVKIEELGWLNSTGWNDLMLGGTWATNELIANRFAWNVTIPRVLIEGHYVLRHEIIALHVAEQVNGAQAYPQCVNLRVTGSPDKEKVGLSGGVVGSKLYGINDPGILVDIHQNIDSYTIPGPKLWDSSPRREHLH